MVRPFVNYGLALAAILTVLYGCSPRATTATDPSSSTPRSATTLRVDQRLDARENLDRLAAGENAKDHSTEVNVPVPAGVEPSALARRDPGDPKAWLTFSEALKRVTARVSALLPTPPSERVIDPEAHREALKRYAHGRAAAMEGRYLVAATELQKALELDPDSVEIMRELARLYAGGNAQVSNPTRAMELYQRLADLEPDNAEAIFTVGLAQATRRDFERSAATLGRWRLDGRSFDHDSAADLLVDFTLAMCLRELGCDRASIESAQQSLAIPAKLEAPTGYTTRLASVYRQRGETWRSIGDAYCRLGEYPEALKAYAQSGLLPTADPAAIHARVLYANLRMGRVFNAQREMLAALRSGGETISERDLHLCAYVAEYAQPLDLLTQIVAQMHRGKPEDASLARAAALLSPPDQALAILREFVARNPRDMDAVSQLLTWLAQRDVTAAVRLTIGLIADHPDLADDYARSLSQAVPRSAKAIDATRQIAQSADDSPARAFLETRLLAGSGALGEAWGTGASARTKWPNDSLLRVQQIQLAAALEDAALLEQVTHDLAKPDVASLVAISQAYRVLGQIDKAIEAAEAAVHRDPESVDALVELARVHAARASLIAAQSTTKAPARADVDAAAQAADRAIALEPTRDEPYEILAMLYGPGGVLADSKLYDQFRQRLREANPDSPLHARLAAQDLILQRRYDLAIERLLNLYDTNPADTAALSLAVTCWDRAGKLDAAEQWLSDKIAQRPADGALLDQWARVKLRENQADAAIARLKATIEKDADNLPARRTLETLYRATDRMDEALQLGEQRLLARPEGPRRAVELAAMYAGAGRNAEAFAQLQWMLDHIQTPTVEQLASAIAITGRIRNDDARRDALTLALVENTIDRFPEAPLQVYGNGLRALARQGETGAKFDDLAERAVKHAERASGPAPQDLLAWQSLAQGLADDGHVAAAARALRVRLRSSAPLDDVSKAVIALMIISADAASAQVDQTITLIGKTDQRIRGQWTILPGLEPPANLTETYFQVSSQYNILGDDEGSERLLRETLKLFPDHPMAMNNLGYKLIADGRDDPQAIAWVEKAYQIMPDDPNILDTLGWLRYKQGRFSKDQVPEGAADRSIGAIDLILASLKIAEASRGDGGPEVLDHLGDTYWRLGKKEQALEAWKRVVSMIDNTSFRERVLRQYSLIQTQLWHLLVVDPQTIYEKEYGAMLGRVKQKIAAAESGEQPQVAPTFAEQARTKAESAKPEN